MGKRSSYARLPQDKYYTRDVRAVAPLLRHVRPGMTFIEPCAGAGHLREHLEAAGLICVQALDIAPEGPGIDEGDALTAELVEADLIITNPPWKRDLLHPMIQRFSAHAPTWLLFDSDWMHTSHTDAFGWTLRAVQVVGYRIRWIEGTGGGGMDNAAWHMFDSRGAPSAHAALYLREAS